MLAYLKLIQKDRAVLTWSITGNRAEEVLVQEHMQGSETPSQEQEEQQQFQ